MISRIKIDSNLIVIGYFSISVVSFLFPVAYIPLTYIQFSLIAPILILSLMRNNLFDLIFVTYSFFLMVGFLFSVPGSAFGYFSSALIGIFMGRKYGLKPESIPKKSLFFTAILFIFSSLYLLYTTSDAENLDVYFSPASINYASLTLSSFLSLYLLFTILQSPNFLLHQSYKENPSVIFNIFLLTIILWIFLFTYQTRVVLISAAFILFYVYNNMLPTKLKYFIVVIFPAFIFLNLDTIYNLGLNFVVPGREEFSSIFNTELSIDSNRIEVALNFIESSLPHFGFCYTCSDYFAYSGIVNLFVMAFPFSMILIFYLFVYFVFSFVFILIAKDFSISSRVTIFLIFTAMLIQSFLQADFLSLTMLFFSGHLMYALSKLRLKKMTAY